MEKEDKKHYVLITDFNAFMYDYTLHRRRKDFCRYCLQDFSSVEILKYHCKNFLKTDSKQMIKMSEKVNTLDSKILKEK